MKSYGEIIKPLFNQIDYGRDEEAFLESCQLIPPWTLQLFSAHIALAEIHNGGFLQLFWNHAGLLVPEATEGLFAMDMSASAGLLQQVSSLLGTPFPRNREDRWSALLSATNCKPQELESCFEQADNLYLGFVAATASLELDALSDRFWQLVTSENRGFQAAATAFANRCAALTPCSD